MKKLFTLLGVLMLAMLAWSQPGNVVRCYSHEHLQDQIRQDPQRGRSLEALDRKVDEIIQARQSGNATNAKKPGGGGGGGGGSTPRTTTIYIPVVVNVVYNTVAENITDAQVKSQIDVLNKDYNAANIEVLNQNSYDFAGYNTLIANCKIVFVLDKIFRRQTTVTSFSTNDAMKKTSSGGLDPTSPTTKLNLWSCNMGGGILGYAQFPGGSAATDGVVILYSAFGTSQAGASATNYNEGRTATHEIGHWLGLRHIWGDRRCGDDYVGDTPLHDGANYKCPGAGHRSLCSGAPLEQYMNYMDYTYDLCMYMFTKGQLARMDGYISSSRAAYCLTSNPTPAIAQKINYPGANDLQVYPTVASDAAQLVISSSSKGTGEIIVTTQSGRVMRHNGVLLNKGNTYYQLDVSNLSNGMYIIRTTNADGAVQTRKIIVQH